jgi:hypothetical protein
LVPSAYDGFSMYAQGPQSLHVVVGKLFVASSSVLEADEGAFSEVSLVLVSGAEDSSPVAHRVDMVRWEHPKEEGTFVGL